MGSPHAKRRLIVYVTLIGCGLAVCGWQAQEHLRFKRTAADALVNRGRDITSTLGVLVRSQRRFGLVSKERLQSALQDLMRPEELESIAILAATGETIASAGDPVDLTPEMLHAKGAYWRERSLTIMNVIMELEDRFDVTIPINVAADIVTIDHLAQAVVSQRARR